MRPKPIVVLCSYLWDGLVAIKESDGETRIITQAEFDARYVQA